MLPEKWTLIECPDIIPDTYEISTYGNIRFKDTHELIQPYISTTNNIFIGLLTNDQTFKMFEVGKLVLLSYKFVDKFENMMVVNHKNADKSDNCLTNLDVKYDKLHWEDLGKLGYTNGYWLISQYGDIFGTRYNKPMRQKILRGGYYAVQGLSIGNKHGLTRNVHRLVAEMFIVNPKPNMFHIVNHIDGNKLNNSYLNLEWCNQSLNNIHALYMKLIKTKHGELNHSAKMTNTDVHTICRLLIEYNGDVKIVSKLTNVNGMSIKSIRNGYSWTSISKNYFPKGYFCKPKNILSNNEVHLICQLLKDNNMDSNTVMRLLGDDTHIKLHQIVDLKNKRSFISISDQYF